MWFEFDWAKLFGKFSDKKVLRVDYISKKKLAIVCIKGRGLNHRKEQNPMKNREINLQLFAEPAGSTGAEAAGTAESQLATGTQSAEVSGEGDGQVATGTAEQRKSFEELIAGDYKDDFQKKMQGIVKSRIKDNKSIEARMNKVTPLLDMFAKRYGIDSSDMTDEVLEQIIERTLDDNAFYEDEALKKGIDVDVYKALQKTERENAVLRRFQENVIQTQESQQKFLAINREAEELKKLYPGFDLDIEMANKEFQRLAWDAGVPLQTVYEVIHKDEIMAAGMKTVAQKTAEKISASIQAGTYRPTEGAISEQSATLSGPKKFSKEELEDIRQRVRTGERVVL